MAELNQRATAGSSSSVFRRLCTAGQASRGPHRVVQFALRANSWCLARLLIAVWTALFALHASAFAAPTIVLKDGRRLNGHVGKVAGLADPPLNTRSDEPLTITFIDDDLKRVFIPTTQVQRIDEVESGEVKQRIGIQQHVAKSGADIHRVGPIVNITPFDEFGHRTFSMMGQKGRLDVIQGITMITPVYTKVEGLVTKRTPYIWDMRVATSSIDKAQLKTILSRRVDPKNLEQRLNVVRLFLQLERYADAQQELEQIIKDFPQQQELAKEVQSLRQLHARSIVKEIGVRRKAGQHVLCYNLLKQFPTEDVAGETLQQVSGALAEYDEQINQRQTMLTELSNHIAALKDLEVKSACEALFKELTQELNINTLARMSAYWQAHDDEKQTGEEKLALAFSGWLMGSDQAESNLMTTLSLARMRELVREYLNEPEKLAREKILHRLRGQEGSSVARVARLIAFMKPPGNVPETSVATPGFYKLSVPIGIENEADATYYVQLPPQYDPHVRYPTILTLNGSGTTPEKQIDWWAGATDGQGNRLGQASRLGYIVIAVGWLNEGQKEYEFSAREHAAVLGSLRDACRRFSIDTDRVFLTGHSLGGNAAWDMGLAHPDLWAGVIPIVAESEKYCSLYWENAGLVPFYVLCGEKDGDKTIKNARDLNRYMIKRFDVTVTEYRGRGHEDFYEDIQNIFDWMGRRAPRNFYPKQFTVNTMRNWDNYFWWIEADKLPARGVVEPVDWPPARGVRPVQITGKVLNTNGVSITTGASQISVWLSPEIVDFNRPMTLRLNGGSFSRGSSRVEPEMSVLLEDVRTRGDRLHPFWAKVSQ